jgi:sodium-dependent phosphate cotransporter
MSFKYVMTDLKTHIKTVSRLAATLAILFLFLVAIKMLGSSFKLLGKDFVNTLITTNMNPFTGLFVGVLATVLVQSSSVTTSLVVGLVSGGVLSVGNAVPIVMGANIGTTVTNALVSFGHVSKREEFRRAFSGSIIHDFFNLIAVAILLPIEIMTGFLQNSAAYLSSVFYGVGGVEFESPIKVVVGSVVKMIQQMFIDYLPLSEKATGVLMIIVSCLLIFICLFGLVKLLRKIMIGRIVHVLDRALSRSVVITMSLGVLITVAVQSSSITTSLLVPLLGAGIITLETAFPIILGANIGTTVTALLASLSGTQAGLTIALVHLLFNISGIIMIYPLKTTREIPLRMARWLGDKVMERRRVAVVFVLLVFFIIPFGVMLISKAF